jgi:hypothetical protein
MRVFSIALMLVLAGAILLFAFDLSLNQTTPLSRFDPASPDQAKPLPVGRTILSAVMMLIGILAGVFHSAVMNKSEITSFRQEFIRSVRSPQLIKSILAAPIVFSAVYLATREQPDLILASIFAFQNGFFCDSVLRTQGQRTTT